MKKVFRCLLIIPVAAAMVVMFAANLQAAITGTDHDFSGETWSGGEICVVCHTPHNSNTSVAEAPLWNHEVTTATFDLYNSPTFNSSTTIGQPDGNSKLCLSCHDGTVAINSFDSVTGSLMIGGPALLGTDLSNDHPISFTYDAALATDDGELQTPAGGVVGTAELPLFSDKMQCGTCHDVHGRGPDKFLMIDNTGSALCLNCHIK